MLEDASREKQKGIQGQWQQQSPFRILEQVRGHADVGCGSQMMRRGKNLAKQYGSWEEFKERNREEDKSSELTLERIREASKKVAWDEIGRLGIVQEIRRKSTDFLRRVIAPVGGMGGVTLSEICPQQQKEETLQLVVCGVWRQIRVEGTQQNSGCVARYRRQRSTGVQGARGSTRVM